MIELNDVHKSFGKVEVLKGITASVEKGEVVCIVGPSGSGKSTILRCINGLESYDRGEISVENLARITYSLERFAKIAELADAEARIEELEKRVERLVNERT